MAVRRRQRCGIAVAEFLRSSDAFVWSIESDPRLRSTIVSLVLFDRSPDWNEVLARFESLSLAMPMFRQRLVPSPLTAPPHWEFDPDFDLAFHVRRLTAPAPGTVQAVLEMARIASMADFDRARPLWEVTLIDGLTDGGAALMCKLNHVLTDGVGAVAMAKTLFDGTERFDPRQVATVAPVPPAPGPVAQLREALLFGVGGVVGSALTAAPHIAVEVIRNPLRALTSAASAAASIYRTVQPLNRSTSRTMSGRSTIRRLAVHELPKDALHRAGSVAGGSLNDAFIAGVSGGLRRYGEKHGRVGEEFIAMMPISVRMPSDPGGGNRATLMRFDLPTAIADPAERIGAVHERTSRARSEKSLAHTQLVAGAMNLAPRWYVGSTLRSVDLIASDVPGSPTPVFLAGAAVRAQYAFSPTLGAAVNLTLLSYVDTCAIGVNVDPAAIPDVDVFFDCLVAGFDEVLALAD